MPADWDARMGLAGPATEAGMIRMLVSRAEQDRDRDDDARDDHGGNEVFLFEHFSHLPM